ncbi:MAG TPA: cupin domain-containing protein [Solirubrobacteraceae bacterium]|nr:cupin domain-containing protein [Solirubrobacteraceae bacterium]
MARAGDQLVNSISGERIVFRRTAGDTAGELLEMDAHWARPGRRTPEHRHPCMEERWEVIAGCACFRVGGVEQMSGPGDTAVALPGVTHEAWNSGEEPAHVRIQMRPALRWELFVERLFALANDAHARGCDAPELESLLALMREFPSEIAGPAPTR